MDSSPISCIAFIPADEDIGRKAVNACKIQLMTDCKRTFTEWSSVDEFCNRVSADDDKVPDGNNIFASNVNIVVAESPEDVERLAAISAFFVIITTAKNRDPLNSGKFAGSKWSERYLELRFSTINLGYSLGSIEEKMKPVMTLMKHGLTIRVND